MGVTLSTIAFFSLPIVAICALGFVIKTQANTPVAKDPIWISLPVEGSEFKWVGKSLSDPSLRLADGTMVPSAIRYVEAVDRFPSLVSCIDLPDASLTASKADVLKLRWSLIRTDAEFEVCLYYIGTALADIETLARWFLMSGFSVRVDPESSSSSRRFVFATWRSEINGALAPYSRPVIVDWSERLLTGAMPFNVSMSYDDSGRVTSVSAGIALK